MKIRVFISALSLLFGITSVYGQVNLSEMVPASTTVYRRAESVTSPPVREGVTKCGTFPGNSDLRGQNR